MLRRGWTQFLPLSCVYFSEIKINDTFFKENRVLAMCFNEMTFFPSTFRRHLGSVNPTVLWPWECVEYSHGTLQMVLAPWFERWRAISEENSHAIFVERDILKRIYQVRCSLEREVEKPTNVQAMALGIFTRSNDIPSPFVPLLCICKS